LHGVIPLHSQTSCGFGLRLYHPILSATISIISNYISHLQASMNSVGDQTSAMVCVVANTWAIVRDLLPKVVRHCSLHFDRPVTELQHLAARCSTIYEEVLATFVHCIADAIVNKHLSHEQVLHIYINAKAIPAAEPSDLVQRWGSQLLSVTSHTQECLHVSVQRRLVYHLWATVAQQMLASLNACVASLNTCTESTGSVDCTVLLLNDSLSSAGYSQLALDCYFVVALYDLARSIPDAGAFIVDDRDSGAQRPHEWHQLLCAIDTTARAEGSEAMACEFAEKMWVLHNDAW